MKVYQFFFLVAFFSVGQLIGQSNYQIKGSKVTIKGTSNLHDWETEVTKTTAKGAIDINGGAIESISNLTVEMEVSSIKSSKGNAMDKRTYAALKQDQHPKITFKLTNVSSIQKSGAGFTIKAKGNLTIAGATQPVDLIVTGKTLANGDVQFSGSKALKMTSFKVDPPTALLGTMKTGDDVTVDFSVTLSPAN